MLSVFSRRGLRLSLRRVVLVCSWEAFTRWVVPRPSYALL